MRRKQAGAVAAALAALGMVVSGCSSATPGAAAIVGEQRISERQLNEQVEQVLTAQGRPADTASESLVATTLDRMITTSLVEQYAAEQGIEVTDGELDATVAMYAEASGGREALEQSLLGQDLAPDDIPEIIRVNILAQKIGIEMAPNGSPEEQSNAVFQAVTDFSEEVGTTVSPRYGAWDPVGLAITGVPNDLSIPVQPS